MCRLHNITNNNNKRVTYFTRCLVRELFVNFARHFRRILVLKSLMNECCNKKVWLLSNALLYCNHSYWQKNFRYSEINTYIKNTNVLGKVSTQLGSKYCYPSTCQSYSSSWKGIGERKRKKQGATLKSLSTYFDKLLQKQTGFFLLFSVLLSINFWKKKTLRDLNLSVLSIQYVATLLHYSITFHCCWIFRSIAWGQIKRARR